ncbi:XRE family transcriptional regulator [Parasaccharibacter sp. TMW 2.1888]|uniref:helix-turn-helix domain-containing protein n=1 Tax=Parasaccharibacter sp. TMW 2.1888 TaxID=2268025 RepID=UPI002062D8D3|nr:XRE family transcriptional regulator [Parasaccharibacter sp. TMW 2.1888]
MSKILTISEIERRARSCGISRSELCERAGISPSTYTRWKNGTSTPLVKTYERLIAAIDKPDPTQRSAP